MKNITFLLLSAFMATRAYCWDFSDFNKEITSPARGNVRDVLFIGASLTLAAAIFEDKIDVVHDEVANDRPLGDWSRYGEWSGQVVPNILYVAGQSLSGSLGNTKGYGRALGMFKATAYAASVTTVLKYTVREPRPDNHQERNSWPSGHTTTAFAFGGYVFAEHGWKWGVPALMVSTLSGLSRINDNRHRLHDVFGGATIGLIYGLGIAQLNKSNSAISTYNLVPIYDQQIKGLFVTKDF